MAKTAQINPVGMAYARSLLELASENGSEVAIGAELASIAELLTADETVGMFFKDPSVSSAEHARVIRSAFAGKVSPLVLNTLLVMSGKGRTAFLSDFLAGYRALLDEKLGKIDVEVTVASRLGDAGVEEVRQLVNKALSKDATIHQTVDESILGGLILRMGDRMIDGSVKSQLAQIKNKMLMARAK